MKTFYTSDNHFGHANILKYEDRPFSNVEEMDLAMIEKWNKKVSKNDRVFILGDFTFKSGENAINLLKQLKGHKFLIKGNHDRFIKDKNVQKEFVDIVEYDEYKIDDKTIIMFHYPIDCWNKKHYGSIHLYGHVHSNFKSNHPIDKPQENSYNVGVDINNYEPCTLEEVIENNRIWIETHFDK